MAAWRTIVHTRNYRSTAGSGVRLWLYEAAKSRAHHMMSSLKLLRSCRSDWPSAIFSIRASDEAKYPKTGRVGKDAIRNRFQNPLALFLPRFFDQLQFQRNVHQAVFLSLVHILVRCRAGEGIYLFKESYLDWLTEKSEPNYNFHVSCRCILCCRRCPRIHIAT